MPAIIDNSRDRSPHIIRFTGCLVPHRGELIEKDVWMDSASGKIVQDQQVFYGQRTGAAECIDLGGRIVAPGLIDAQLNGAYGFDFSEAQASVEKFKEGLRQVHRRLIETGVTSYVPTVTSQKPEVYRQVLPCLGPSGASRRAEDGSESLGAHIEGPFISPKRNGCHSVDVLKVAKTGMEELIECYGADNILANPHTGERPPVRVMTAAPELGCMTALIPHITRQGIVFSTGHTDATYEQAMAAIAQGSTLVTHMFNAMRPFTHRSPGPFGLLGQDDLPRPYYGLISDGIHLHPTSIQIAYKNHPAGVILVTDAMKYSGMPDGTYEWTNGERVVKRGSKLTLEANGRIAGSSAQLIQCINNFRRWAGATTAEAIAAATETPARMLGLQHVKGSLEPGADADLVVLSDEPDPKTRCRTLVVDQVWKFGKKVVDSKSKAVTAVGDGRS